MKELFQVILVYCGLGFTIWTIHEIGYNLISFYKKEKRGDSTMIFVSTCTIWAVYIHTLN